MLPPLQAIEKLKLDTETPEPGVRPKGLGMVSCVGTEYVPFSSPLPLENKVEEYMNDIISKMRGELRLILRNSVADYPKKARDRWLFDWPSQVILVVNQIFWCMEVEEVRRKPGQAGEGVGQVFGCASSERKDWGGPGVCGAWKCLEMRERVKRWPGIGLLHGHEPSGVHTLPGSHCLPGSW